MTEPRNLSPEALGGTSVRVNLIIPNPDAVAARAVAAGAKVLFPVEDQPYGFRQGGWWIPSATTGCIGRPLSN
jgi:PhnB protein